MSEKTIPDSEHPVKGMSQMSNTIANIATVQALAAAHGLVLRGGFDVGGGDAVPVCGGGQTPGVLLLFGQVGSGIWPVFSRSAEYADGEADPMDRWSRRVGTALALTLRGTALFPFEGPPWHPFGRWAQRAEAVRPSPLGILMHPEYGLWHAYRFAIALPASPGTSSQLQTFRNQSEAQSEAQFRAGPAAAPHACDSCAETPCLHACPVGAFSNGKYDVVVCAGHLRETETASCHQLGCLARAACPEARSLTYEPAHLQFHMQQFYGSLS